MTTAITKTEVKNSKKGFTLVELVVVIAILAILAAIAIPVVSTIINTASRNGALSNAQTIELAVKECQADIAARNNEVYDGATTYSYVDPAGNTITGTLPDIRTAHANIDIQDVAGAKGIGSAFAGVTFNGVDYEPYWDPASDSCVFIATAGGANTDLETGNAYAGTPVANCVQLAPAGAIATNTIDADF